MTWTRNENLPGSSEPWPISHFISFAVALTISLTNGAVQAEQGYLGDTSRCTEHATRKERVQVPTGRSVTVIEISLPPDSALFSACMQLAGHPPPKIEAEQYLTIMRACLSEARGVTAPEAAYKACIARRGIVVEVLPEDDAR